MTQQASIRPVTPEDEAAWRTLWTGYLEFYETSVPEAVYSSTFSRILSANRGEPGTAYEPHGLFAQIDDRPVGLVHYIFHRHCWTLANVCYLQDLYAVPEMRGHGIGRALIEAVYSRADAAGSANVYWMTQHFNADARKLYDRIAKVTPFIKYSRT